MTATSSDPTTLPVTLAAPIAPGAISVSAAASQSTAAPGTSEAERSTVTVRPSTDTTTFSRARVVIAPALAT